MNDKLNTLCEKLTKNTDLEKSAVDLVNGVADMFDGLSHDPPGIKNLVAELKGCATLLAAGVLSGTHPQPAPVPVPPPVPAPIPAEEKAPEEPTHHHKGGRSKH